jgi:hypothetical protein
MSISESESGFHGQAGKEVSEEIKSIFAGYDSGIYFSRAAGFFSEKWLGERFFDGMNLR